MRVCLWDFIVFKGLRYEEWFSGNEAPDWLLIGSDLQKLPPFSLGGSGVSRFCKPVHHEECQSVRRLLVTAITYTFIGYTQLYPPNKWQLLLSSR